MAGNFEETSAAEALNRIWDRTVLGESIDERDHEGGELASIANLKACDDTPAPDSAFVAQLRQQFAIPEKNAIRPARPSPVSLGTVQPYSAPLPAVPVRRLLIAAAVAACLTLILWVGSGLFHNQAHAPVIASVLASPEDTATAGPTMTTWIQQTSAVSTGHKVTLLPHFAATVTTQNLDVLAPQTPLTIVEIASDGTGRQWLHVETKDGRSGWLPQGDAYPIQQ